jgi:hypothetical protein
LWCYYWNFCHTLRIKTPLVPKESSRRVDARRDLFCPIRLSVARVTQVVSFSSSTIDRTRSSSKLITNKCQPCAVKHTEPVLGNFMNPVMNWLFSLWSLVSKYQDRKELFIMVGF